LASIAAFDIEKISEITEWIALKGYFTKDLLREKFGLADKNELRPLLATLQSDGLIETNRGFRSTAKMIQLYKLTGGVSSFGDGKDGNRGKIERCKAIAAMIAMIAAPQEGYPLEELILRRERRQGIEFAQCNEHN